MYDKVFQLVLACLGQHFFSEDYFSSWSRSMVDDMRCKVRQQNGCFAIPGNWQEPKLRQCRENTFPVVDWPADDRVNELPNQLGRALAKVALCSIVTKC